MNTFASWFTPDVLRTLGLSLLHFLWQGAVLAVLAAASLAFARKASTRYVLAIGALLAMVAAPVFTYLALRESSPVSTASAQNSVPVMVHAVNLASLRIASSAQSSFVSGNLLTTFVELWFVGVLLFSLRTAGGFFLVARLRRRDCKPMNLQLLALCREMDPRHPLL
jgi:hypothetical protein